MLLQNGSTRLSQLPLGIDVVGWPPTSRHQLSRRWLQRIFDQHEISSIRHAPSPLMAAWYGWAAKEAAFKALSYFQEDIPFRPRQFVISYLKGIPQLATNLRIQHSLKIHCKPLYAQESTQLVGLQAIALDSAYFPAELTVGFHATLPTNPHSLVQSTLYQYLIEHLSAKLCIARSSLNLEPRRKYKPLVQVNGVPIHLPISLSHHQSLGVWAFLTES